MVSVVCVAKTFHVSFLFVYLDGLNVIIVRRRVLFLDKRVSLMLQALLNYDLLPFQI